MDRTVHSVAENQTRLNNFDSQEALEFASLVSVGRMLQFLPHCPCVRACSGMSDSLQPYGL